MTGFPASRSIRAAHSPFRFFLWRCSPWLVTRWYDRYLQRLDLAEIDDHLLRDLGLTREGVRRECAKSFWRP